MQHGSAQGTIEVQTKFFFFSVFLYFCKPNLSLDGSEPAPIGWGVRRIPVAPGPHHVRIFVPYPGFPVMGDNSVVVDVVSGSVVRVSFRAPLTAFWKGRMKVVGVVPGPSMAPTGMIPVAPGVWAAAPAVAPPMAGAWHADPSGRHQLRYFDGRIWTAHVSDHGVTGLDPIA